MRSTTMRLIVWLCPGNGICWMWCSYLLGRTEIAESLSQVAITEILGIVLTYAVKSLVENLSKYNSWPDAAKQTDENDVPLSEL